MLQEAIVKAPVQVHLDFIREFILETDASLNDLRAMMS